MSILGGKKNQHQFLDAVQIFANLGLLKRLRLT